MRFFRVHWSQQKGRQDRAQQTIPLRISGVAAGGQSRALPPQTKCFAHPNEIFVYTIFHKLV